MNKFQLCKLIALIFISFSSHAINVVKVSPVKDSDGAVTRRGIAKVVTSEKYILASYVNAHVKYIKKPGERVEKGDVVAQLDTQFLQLERKQLKLNIDKLNAQSRYLRTELKRMETLSSSKAVKESEVESLRFQLKESEIEQQIEEAKLDEANRYISLGTVTANANGFVAETFVSLGDYVETGENIARLVDAGSIELLSHFPLDMVAFIREGDSVDFEAGDLSGKAVISRIVREVSDGTESVNVFFIPERHVASRMLVGTSLDVNFSFDIPGTALIPNDALVPQGNTSYVMKLGDDNRVKKVPVNVIASEKSYYVVHGPLVAGDKLVVRGGLGLEAEEQVEVMQGGQE